MVVEIPKHHHLLEVELYWPQNVASVAMVRVVGWQKIFGNSTKDKVNRLGKYSFSKKVFGETSTSNSSYDHQLLNPGPFE